MSNTYHGWRTDLILVRYKEIHIPYRSLKLKLRDKRKQGLEIQPRDELTKYNLTRMRKMMREVLNYRGIFDIKAVLREPANLVWSCPVTRKGTNQMNFKPVDECHEDGLYILLMQDGTVKWSSRENAHFTVPDREHLSYSDSAIVYAALVER